MVADITIQPARIRDAKTLNKMFIQSLESSFGYFSDEYRTQLQHDHSSTRIAKALCSSRSCFLVLRHKAEAVGYSLARIDGRETGFIHWMYVLPVMQGQGLGAKLLLACQKSLQSRGVNRIRLLTHDQKGFYERYGYEEKGRLPHCGGVPMVIMETVV